ncbi:MAG: signal peptidase I [Planctomycetota bacterium]
MTAPPTSTSSTENETDPEAGTGSGSKVSDAEVAKREFEAMTVPQQRAVVFRSQSGRETVEAFVVAFLLALLFRAFVAEAFVIPTGSMAPALMGAHKDLACQQCGQTFPVGASAENRGPVMDKVVVGGICPNCRYVNPLDLVETPDHGTFTGDRILVSKFAYTIKEPKRWDVIVFKVPVNPKQNYIKRLVGLPGETITVRHGDVYAQQTNSSAQRASDDSRGSILRKDPTAMLAMRHFVYDSDRQAAALVQANYPSRLQAWTRGTDDVPTDGWQVERSVADGLTATLEGVSEDGEAQWIRYYHHWPRPDQWRRALAGQSLANVDAYDARLITDFHAYDSYITVPSFLIYRDKPASDGISLLGRLTGRSRTAGSFRPSFQSGGDLSQFGGSLTVGGTGLAADGTNWVGDLIVDVDVETVSDAERLTLEIVEAGIRYQCRIDLASGLARMAMLDGRGDENQEIPWDEEDSPIGDTSIRAGRRHDIRFANCDDELMLWVDGDVVALSRPARFDPTQFTKPSQDRPHYAGPGNPLDASPVGLTVDGGATLHRMRIDRDKYYIATSSEDGGIIDYDLARIARESRGRVGVDEIQAVFGYPEVWDQFSGWQARRSVSFELGPDQFFPMGDNSPESLDARCWAGSKAKERFGVPSSPDDDAYKYSDAAFVPRDLLVGKALMIFWPHTWRTPVPWTPNFKRMGLIH